MSDPPNIDFRNNDILVVLGGTQGSGGYSIHIKDVDSRPHRTVVRLLVCHPPKDSTEVTEVTSPYDVVLAPKLATPIDWITIEGCNQ
ncbi:protease complex subunit PrcB family protein [Methylomonas methanica]